MVGGWGYESPLAAKIIKYNKRTQQAVHQTLGSSRGSTEAEVMKMMMMTTTKLDQQSGRSAWWHP